MDAAHPDAWHRTQGYSCPRWLSTRELPRTESLPASRRHFEFGKGNKGEEEKLLCAQVFSSVKWEQS